MSGSTACVEVATNMKKMIMMTLLIMNYKHPSNKWGTYRVSPAAPQGVIGMPCIQSASGDV